MTTTTDDETEVDNETSVVDGEADSVGDSVGDEHTGSVEQICNKLTTPTNTYRSHLYQ